MTAPERLRISGPEDILGFIPHSLGYWPESSLVAITMHGNLLGATLRLDLPGPEVLADPGKYVRLVRGYLDADKQADGTLLAFFTSKGGSSPGPEVVDVEYHALLSGLDCVLEEAGLPVRDAWYIGDDYWRDAYCTDASCCPPQGRPLQAILDSTLNAEMVYRGSSVGPAPGTKDGPATPVSSLYRSAVLEAQEGWWKVLDCRRDSRAQFVAVLEAWEVLMCRRGGEPWLPGVERDAFLRASLLIPAWRDALLVMAAAGKHAAEAGVDQFGVLHDGAGPHPVAPPGGPLGGNGQNRAAGDADAGASPVPGYAEVLMGVAPSVPDWERLNALDLVLEQLAALGGPAAAASLTLRGWIAWSRGRGSYAAAYLSDALDVEPGYRLAELLLELVGRGAICGWAARKDAAWHKF
ncbi:DUF4192 family protein [Arthrobacter sp. MPF02]|uniref:DUF4192 family protein n=1 Tax=Arthrobacter sp. MPF02 TaxID=3388492 RepID=UPI0039846E14